MSRKVCNWCGQELSHSAYYLHLNDRYAQACPAQYQKHDNLDSTFDFGSSSLLIMSCLILRSQVMKLVNKKKYGKLQQKNLVIKKMFYKQIQYKVLCLVCQFS